MFGLVGLAGRTGRWGLWGSWVVRGSCGGWGHGMGLVRCVELVAVIPAVHGPRGPRGACGARGLFRLFWKRPPRGLPDGPSGHFSDRNGSQGTRGPMWTHWGPRGLRVDSENPEDQAKLGGSEAKTGTEGKGCPRERKWDLRAPKEIPGDPDISMGAGGAQGQAWTHGIRGKPRATLGYRWGTRGRMFLFLEVMCNHVHTSVR